MKKILFAILLLFSMSVYAAPPYFGVSIGEHLALDNAKCISVAQKVLKKDGFKKLLPKGNNLFAAYNNGNQYGYKAVIRCMAKQNAFVVVTVADSMKTVKKKADSLRSRIQQHFKRKSEKSEKKTYSATPSPSQNLSIMTQSQKNTQGGYTAKSWQDTTFTRVQCLMRAETALRDTKLADVFELYHEIAAVSGTTGGYTGTIRCLVGDGIILFSVSGQKSAIVNRLLERLQHNF